MKQPIRLEVLDNTVQHFAVYFDKPGRIEVMLVGGTIIAYAYSGSKPDIDQDPEFMYDGAADGMESIGL